MKEKITALHICIDAKPVEQEIKNLNSGLRELENNIKRVGNTIAETFDFSAESARIDMLSSSITAAAQELGNLSMVLSEQTSMHWPDMLGTVGDVCTILQTLITLTEANVAAKAASIAEDVYIITLYAVDYAKAFGLMVAGLAMSAAAWVKDTAAKVADKAVDLAIISLYVGDYIKAFGAVIGKIALSTATWIANTSAKVANTAAEWAQIAATTAWNAICTAATAVTTAFGAAMAFVTSPIGLVVTAIAALIAIVVLLIANWDTVKAVALGVWETIKAAFGTAAGWFNTNVVQPVAGFFAGLWNGFKQAAVSAWEGVKSVFSTVASFFGDIFGKAWAGVVKVFSAAGNVFNNIKDGILTVFRSIVNGLIDGINAVVAIPFRGLNSALTFVRSVEIAGIRPFSGLRTLSIPQIPHLARGAVLPANKPFLAVVGDQHHGTNVEAPLATIQEAVRSEVGEMMAVMVTSLDALLRENRALRRTVEGISVGDEVIGRAAQRYEQRMAVIGGTY